METVSSKQPFHLLLIEDNLPDIVLLQKAIERCGKQPFLHIVRDGEEAMMFLRKEGKYSEAVRPNLILLDINLPKKSGYEVLHEIKQDERLKSILVIVLTSSSAETDAYKSRQYCADSHLVKPCSLNEYIQMVNRLEKFWTETTSILR